MLYANQHVTLGQKWPKSWFWLCFWLRFGLVLDYLRPLLGSLSQVFYTQHVTAAQKLAKPMVLGLFLFGIRLFFFLLFLVLIQILNVLAKPFPMIPNTPESDLKCMRYRVGKMTNIFTYIQNSFICLDICVQANIYKLSLAKVCSNKLRLKINKTSSAFLG